MQVPLPLVMTGGVVKVEVGIVVESVGVGIVESFVERIGGVVATKYLTRRNKCESSETPPNENKFPKRIETIYTMKNIILDSVNAIVIVNAPEH